jgi:hypothetical protein
VKALGFSASICSVYCCGYFSAAAPGLVLAFAAGLAAALAVVCSDARSARVLSRLAAFERLRVFLRALVFGMESCPLILHESKMVLKCLLTSYALNCQNREIAKNEK